MYTSFLFLILSSILSVVYCMHEWVAVLKKGEQLGIICMASFCLRSTVGGASLERDKDVRKPLETVTCG